MSECPCENEQPDPCPQCGEALARAERAEAALSAAREVIEEKNLAEIAGWALCSHSEGGGPAKCDLMACACGPEGVAIAKAIARAFLERAAILGTKMAPKGQ